MYQNKLILGYHAGKLIILITVGVVFSIITAACQPNQISPTPTMAEPTDFPAGFPTPDPEIFVDCLAKGGRWDVLGFSGPGCNLPTADGGKACRDSEECESGCLGDSDLVMISDRHGPPIPDHVRVDELNAKNEQNTGLCSPWQGNFGCQVWLENGRYVAICVD